VEPLISNPHNHVRQTDAHQPTFPATTPEATSLGNAAGTATGQIS